MSGVGPVLAALDSVKGELEANAMVRAEADTRFAGSMLQKHLEDRNIVHQFKITKTSSVEIFDSEKDNRKEDNHVGHENSKRKKCGCFSSCFGRKG